MNEFFCVYCPTVRKDDESVGQRTDPLLISTRYATLYQAIFYELQKVNDNNNKIQTMAKNSHSSIIDVLSPESPPCGSSFAEYYELGSCGQ